MAFNGTTQHSPFTIFSEGLSLMNISAGRLSNDDEVRGNAALCSNTLAPLRYRKCTNLSNILLDIVLKFNGRRDNDRSHD